MVLSFQYQCLNFCSDIRTKTEVASRYVCWLRSRDRNEKGKPEEKMAVKVIRGGDMGHLRNMRWERAAIEKIWKKIGGDRTFGKMWYYEQCYRLPLRDPVLLDFWTVSPWTPSVGAYVWMYSMKQTVWKPWAQIQSHLLCGAPTCPVSLLLLDPLVAKQTYRKPGIPERV